MKKLDPTKCVDELIKFNLEKGMVDEVCNCLKAIQEELLEEWDILEEFLMVVDAKKNR